MCGTVEKNLHPIKSAHSNTKTEVILLKATDVQEKFFHLIEFLVHQLKYVPCKELIAISLILKAQSNRDCCHLAIRYSIYIRTVSS